MPAIQPKASTVYYAPTARQRYVTAKGAATNEAKARIKAKYPSERAQYIDGRCVDPGWHWTQEPRLLLLHKRYTRLLLRALKKGQPHDSQD